MALEITQICRYPVKGLNAESLPHTAVTAGEGLPDDRRVLYVHPDVGHYGVFNGRRFRDDIYPRVRDFIAKNEAIVAVPERAAAAA